MRSRCGAAHNLDAFDVVNVQRNVSPYHVAEWRQIDTAPIHQHLHAARELVGRTVIRDNRRMPVEIVDKHARHQPEHIRDIAKPGSPDHVAVDDRPRIGRFGQRLVEARCAQHNGKILQVVFFGECVIVGMARCNAQ